MTCFWVGVLSSLISCKIIKAFSLSLFIPWVLTDCVLPGLFYSWFLYTWLLILCPLGESILLLTLKLCGIDTDCFFRGKLGILQYPLCPDWCAQLPEFLLRLLPYSFGDGHIGHPLNDSSALSVHPTALSLFVTIVALKKIMYLVHKALYELVVLLELGRLGPY